MEDTKSILHELYVFSEWKPEPEYLQKPDNILPENISALWRWLKFFGPKKSLIDSITAFKERQQKWHIALADEGKVIAVLTDNILEIRTKRSEYATIAARTTVSRDAYPQWRKLVWSPDCSFVVLAYGNGVISFFDLTASNLFNIPTDCTRPGGLECTDNTHAVADIIFMPLRVKDNKWNWEVLVVTYDGKLRGYLVSQTDGYKLHHTFRFSSAGGVAAMTYCEPHSTLYVCGVPHVACKDPSSPLSAGITAWRILNDEPWYKLSVVSDELDTLVTQKFQLYIPFVSNKNLAFVVQMVLSPNGDKLVCLHCNGDISVWRLPLLKLLHRWPLSMQPGHDLDNPLVKDHVVKSKGKDVTKYFGADVNWWSGEEIILSRFSGAVTICDIENMMNILGKKPEFFQGSPQLTCAHDGTFMVLECESNVLPAKRNRSDDSMEVVKVEEDTDDTMLELGKELIKSVLYAITDMETFQPKPRKITVVSRVYRLLGVKSTTPNELFNRKIESGNYTEALTLADTFNLDSDLVYQQQWRKNPVSTDAIQKYLSKVSKKIWAVHQCVDRLPETLPAAKELLQFGLQLTNEKILEEINKGKPEDEWKDPDDITLEDLNAYTSELLRCRHVMLFYKERLRLYEAILRCEKSTYQKDEYDRLRSNSIVHSAMEIAKEGRLAALTCLWPQIKTLPMQLAVLDNIPETVTPLDYQELLPMKEPLPLPDYSPASLSPPDNERDWCRKEIFRSIWSSNWSEDSSPESEQAEPISEDQYFEQVAIWYEKRAREMQDRCGLITHAVALVTIGMVGGKIEGLQRIMSHLITLMLLIYDVNVEDVTLEDLEKMTLLDTCKMYMQRTSPETFLADLKEYVIPHLKRVEALTGADACLSGLTEYLESISVDDLSYILLVLQSPHEFELDVRTHLELAEKCLLAYTGTDQLDMACDMLDTLLKESDGSISNSEIVRRVKEIELLVSASSKLSWRGVKVPPKDLSEMHKEPKQVHNLLTRMARNLSLGEDKPTQQDWEKLLKDILELQGSLFNCITKEQCYEIYASSLLTSGDATSIKLASEVLTCTADSRRSPHLVNYNTSVELVSNAAKEYCNSASSLSDPALELARACLSLIKDGNPGIQEELDLISALQILNAFNLGVLPIQVRLCEDRMSLIEDCLKLDASAYMASHKLLKLAKLLRICGDDELNREGKVLQRVGEYAILAGPGGCAAAVDIARRLATIRYAPSAPLLSHVATFAHAHADRATRRDLFAAAVTHCSGDDIEDILRARLGLELETLEQMGSALRNEHTQMSVQLSDRCPSTDDEFDDAITTPVIEKKDLVMPKIVAMKPFLNFLLETVQGKSSSSEETSVSSTENKSVHCQEFYHSLYPEHAVSDAHYRYDAFSTPHADDIASRRGQAALAYYYIHNYMDTAQRTNNDKFEAIVVQQCATELIHKDTALSVACLLRCTRDHPATRRLVRAHTTHTVVGATLYATLMRCNAPDLRDNVYLTTPSQMARTTLKTKNASEEQIEIIRQCIEKLSGMGEVVTLRERGFNVNGLLFNADEEYRTETIYRVARSPEKEHLELACSLAAKYKLDPLEVWMQHAENDLTLSHLTKDTLPFIDENTHSRVREGLWPQISGDNHNSLIKYFALLKNIDEKPVICGLTAQEHIKLLKKAKAASPDLDYKLLLEQPSAEKFSAHILEIIKPENVGLLTKFLRSLPPAFKIPISVNAIYTMWLTKYFFSVGSAGASNKKWMQQYRQCASYFNKLGKDDLLEFVTNTCFTLDAIDRVPPGTRNLMIMQAVDYCQQEQENDFKFNKNEQTWAQVGQELTRWARFLENFHSTTIQNIIQHSNVAKDQIWPDIEMSHGDTNKIIECMSRLLLEGELKPPAMATLLQCLHVSATTHRVFEHVVNNGVSHTSDIELLVTRLTQYHKDGVRFSEDLLDKVMMLATEHGLPPHKQISLLSLSQRERVHDTGDMLKIAQYTIDLFRNEWPELEYAQGLHEEKLTTDEGRREVFSKFLVVTDTWQRKKALVDVLVCWPPTKDAGQHSLHFEYLQYLLNASDRRESLVLIKLLLGRPVLNEEEVKSLTENVSPDAVLNAIWIVLLNNCEQNKPDIVKLAHSHKDTILKQEIEEDLIKELLDKGMFLNLVSTPLYSVIINYIIQQDSSSGETISPYTVQWASDQLVNANYLAEAGNLKLLALGVPSALRGFSQSVLYVKNMFN